MGYEIEAIRNFHFEKISYDGYELSVTEEDYESTSWTAFSG